MRIDARMRSQREPARDWVGESPGKEVHDSQVEIWDFSWSRRLWSLGEEGGYCTRRAVGMRGGVGIPWHLFHEGEFGSGVYLVQLGKGGWLVWSYGNAGDTDTLCGFGHGGDVFYISCTAMVVSLCWSRMKGVR